MDWPALKVRNQNVGLDQGLSLIRFRSVKFKFIELFNQLETATFMKKMRNTILSWTSISGWVKYKWGKHSIGAEKTCSDQ